MPTPRGPFNTLWANGVSVGEIAIDRLRLGAFLDFLIEHARRTAQGLGIEQPSR